VIHLDAWCHNFLNARNYKHDIAYGVGSNADLEETDLSGAVRAVR
jgi:hypothetical protein